MAIQYDLPLFVPHVKLLLLIPIMRASFRKLSPSAFTFCVMHAIKQVDKNEIGKLVVFFRLLSFPLALPHCTVGNNRW